MYENIEVHLIESRKRKLCFFPELKLLCELNNQWWKKLKSYKDHQEASHRNLLDDVRAMYQNLQRQFPLRKQWWDMDISTLTLITATDCNIRCSYCYAKQGSYGRKRQLMDRVASKEVVRKVFAAFPDVKHMRFFGGEPLLNVDVITEVCQFVRDDLGQSHMKYSIETNGTLLTDKIIRIVKEYDIDLGISLDGPGELHDLHRVFADGTGTHSLVWRNIKRLAAAEVRFAVACTYTEEHKQMPIETLATYLRSVSPFYQISPCDHPDSGPVQIGDEYLFYPIQHLLEEDPAYHLPTVQLLSTLVSEAIPEHFCEAQSRLTVFPDGSVFPCELLTDQTFYMGNILENDFPASDFYAVRELLSGFKRARMPKTYWFRYLVYPLCIAAYKNVEDLQFTKSMNDLYEKLLVIAGELMSDEDTYAKVINAIETISLMGRAKHVEGGAE